MKTNAEMRTYLSGLLDHEHDCKLEKCPACQSAHNIYESARSLIFSGVAYPDVAIRAKKQAMETGTSTGRARKASAQRAA